MHCLLPCLAARRCSSLGARTSRPQSWPQATAAAFGPSGADGTSALPGWLRSLRRTALLLLLLPVSFVSSAWADTHVSAYVGSSACAACHAQIHVHYLATPMGRSSGRAGSGSFQEQMTASEFSHALSGVRYQVSKHREGFTLDYSQKQSASMPEVRGTQPLTYFIGSGSVGRSYLFSVMGFLFQAPVSYYARSGKWDLAPGYQQHNDLFLMRPVESECLECHASGVQPIAGTQNGYREVPFLEGSISCERCHGPGKPHVDAKTSGKVEAAKDIVNPAKLEVRRRDSVCAQCHLLGEARIVKASRSLSHFAPGEQLADYAVSLVWNSKSASGLKATSHYEKLWQSRCKQMSGDRLWCGTCHAVHSPPTSQQSGAFFSRKCLSCHQSADCREPVRLREAQGDSCAHCHMPKAQSLEAEHSVFTDHSIPRGPRRQPAVTGTDAGNELVSFWGDKVEPRELGLAYAQLAGRRQDRKLVARALGLLKTAEAQGQTDGAVLLQLGYASDQLGNREEAIAYYQRARQQDPSQTVASVNLANHFAMRGRAQEAIALWEDALSRNPGLESARINIATAYLQQGDPKSAEKTLRKALELNPALKAAWRLLADPRISNASK
jgi:predicted CXXCH cytochrome family protein